MAVTTTDIQEAFRTELTRLLSKGLDQDTETLARRYYSDKERQSLNESDFCGPGRTYPVKTQEDVTNAAELAGHADDPAAVQACIRSKAKDNGWSLPKSWQDDGERAVKSDTHPPFSGTHSHTHPAFGAQGDDETHEHEHTHDGDADHGHSHDDTNERMMAAGVPVPSTSEHAPHPPMTGKHSHGHEHMDGYKHEHEHEHMNDNVHDHGHAQAQHRATGTPDTIQATDRHVMSLPLVRIDALKREVWGQATAEVPDSYGTIFGFYPEAWTKWRGNIREQHDPKKAVGKAVDISPDPDERAIYVGSRVSRGAQDTWLKVEDNVLTGYSASIIPDPEFGNDIKRWPKKLYQGKEYPYLPRYTVAELSLVDNPACPGCNIAIVRADGFATDVLDVTEDEPPVEQEAQERAGARIGTATKSKMHDSIGHSLHSVTSQMENCGCENCAAAMKLIDPDGDGDIDLGGYDDPDGDWQKLYNGKQDDMERVVTSLIERSLQPVYSRLQGIAGTLARGNALPINIETIITSSITRALEVLDTRLATIPTETSIAEVRAELSAVKERVVQIAEQPMPGGPVLNASVMPRPIEKQLATDPMPQQTDRSYGAVYEAIQEMSRHGGLDTPEKQVNAMAAALQVQRGGRR
jgi:hypothetical protein